MKQLADDPGEAAAYVEAARRNSPAAYKTALRNVSGARRRKPTKPLAVAFDPDVMFWIESLGKRAKTRVNSILRAAMKADAYRSPKKRDPSVILLNVEVARETDGRYFADIPALPGVMKYGKSKDEALRNVQALALRVIADRLEEGELKQASISFVVA